MTKKVLITKKQFSQVIIIKNEKMFVIKEPQNFCFDFDLPKDVEKNLKHEIKFIIKSNEPLAENKIKNKIEQLFLKYKLGNDNIHEHGKKQNE